MTREVTVLRGSLFAGACYFAAIAFAHTLDIKVPGLFIYFNVPSHPYQDHIIAFLALGWSAFYFVAAADPVNNPLAVKGVLLSSTIALLGLARINLLDELMSSSGDVTVYYFWIQTIGLSFYIAWLYLFYLKSWKNKRQTNG